MIALVVVKCVRGPSDLTATLVIVAFVDRAEFALAYAVVVLREAHIDAVVNHHVVVLGLIGPIHIFVTEMQIVLFIERQLVH